MKINLPFLTLPYRLTPVPTNKIPSLHPAFQVTILTGENFPKNFLLPLRASTSSLQVAARRFIYFVLIPSLVFQIRQCRQTKYAACLICHRRSEETSWCVFASISERVLFHMYLSIFYCTLQHFILMD